ncbi:MAG: metal ABC transporter substrate-binding protein [Fibrobacterota bacterium]
MRGFMIVLAAATTLMAELTIGVSIHPYYSFAKNIVGDKAQVVSLTDEANPHSYKPTTRDIMRLDDVDVMILNGIGHDDFAEDMLQASGRSDEIEKIYANKNVPLIPISNNSEELNSHTFVSISSSISQVYHIANRLSEIDPENESSYRQNAAAYTQKLRTLKYNYLSEFSEIGEQDLRCATTHGGYSYLLQEFGITVNAVLEPSHGVNPTASQMQGVIETIQEKDIRILFSENDYNDPFVDVLKEETGIEAIPLSHLSSGEFSSDHFEKWMEFNIKNILKAVQGAAEYE